jgi:hypothetical protein
MQYRRLGRGGRVVAKRRLYQGAPTIVVNDTPIHGRLFLYRFFAAGGRLGGGLAGSGPMITIRREP